MANDINSFKKASEAALEWLKKEYSSIRTSQASPSILDGILVEAYGSRQPINQVATVSIEGPKSLRVSPWDKAIGKSIDEAIRLANLGISVALDSDGLRISFPELTSDRRTLLVKTAKEKFEEARITLRTEREKCLSSFDREEKEGNIGEDEKFRLRNDLQKLVDEANKKLEELYNKKEKEIHQ